MDVTGAVTCLLRMALAGRLHRKHSDELRALLRISVNSFRPGVFGCGDSALQISSLGGLSCGKGGNARFGGALSLRGRASERAQE